MKKIFLCSIGLFLSFSLLAQAPDITWQKLLGGSASDIAHDIQATPDGGYIIAGYSDSQDGDVSGTKGDYDFWIIKMDVEGNVEWKKTYGGSDWDWPYAIKPTDDGGYIAAGLTYSDDGDVSGFNGFRDGWVIKLNASGDMEWQRCLGGSGADAAQDVWETDDGYLIVGFDGGTNDGDLQGMACDNDFWIVKLDLNGGIVWQQCYGGSDTDLPRKIVPFGNTGYLIAGYAESDDGDVAGQNGFRDFWLIQIDLAGNLVWQKALGGSSWDDAYDLLFSSEENLIILAGETYSDDGDVSMNHGDMDYWVVFLDASGNILLEKTYGGSLEDKATSILQLSSSEFIISGAAVSTDGDVESAIGNGDFWIIKVTTNGDIIWNKSLGGSAYEEPIGSVFATNDNGILLAGRSKSNDGDVSGAHGDNDLWVVKLGGTSTAVNTLSAATDIIEIFPNPAINRNEVYIKHTLANADYLIIRDMTGQLISEKPIKGNNGLISWPVGDLPCGNYFLEVHATDQVQIGKLIIMSR
jgi:hypothetical protein